MIFRFGGKSERSIFHAAGIQMPVSCKSIPKPAAVTPSQDSTWRVGASSVSTFRTPCNL